jgi:ribosomal protein S18 acetylase RimI-like enzyme
LERVAAGPARDEWLPLLRIADDSESEVLSYYQQGDLFVLRGADNVAVGITLVLRDTRAAVDLKSVAIAPELQGRGLGKRMLALVLAELRACGVRLVTVATGNSGIGELAFYQRAGFRLSRIERDFFDRDRGYPTGILENGIPLRDRVWLDRWL